MPYQKYTIATGLLGEGRMHLPFPVAAGEAVVEVPAYVDTRLKKVVAGVVVDRPQAEIDAEDAAKLDADALNQFQTKIIQASALNTRAEINDLRTGLDAVRAGLDTIRAELDNIRSKLSPALPAAYPPAFPAAFPTYTIPQWRTKIITFFKALT